MFSGIIERPGEIIKITPTAGGVDLVINLYEVAEGVKPGDSISVDGVCLTVAKIATTQATFNVMNETLSKTNLGARRIGNKVNLERSLKIGDRIDGHFVQGHVDAAGKVKKILNDGKDYKLWVTPSDPLKTYIVPRGSITVNGVSLTVAAVENDSFVIALIPTTLKRTNLGTLKENDTVNIETDIIARQIVHYMEQQKSPHA